MDLCHFQFNNQEMALLILYLYTPVPYTFLLVLFSVCGMYVASVRVNQFSPFVSRGMSRFISKVFY